MQDEKQFEQLMLQYQQLKNGSEDISRMIDNEDFDNARDSEMRNIKKLEKGMESIQMEIRKTQKSQKLQQAYDMSQLQKGSILNIQE